LLFELILSILALEACAPAVPSTAQPFIPPAAQPAPSFTPQPIPSRILETPTAPNPSPAVEERATSAPTESACENDLHFDQDLTVPDGSVIQPGAAIDKQWLVTNSGSCDWDSSYRLGFVGGDTLGANTDQALYPARSGSPAVLRILFTAPMEAGSYQSAWQAFTPDGTAFGDVIYITINVSF
jgi:hypothetical protein